MDFYIVYFVNNLFAGSFVDKITEFISLIPFIIVLWTTLALLALFFDKRQGKWVFLGIFIALILHFAISEGLFKHLLSDLLFRERPYLAHPGEIIPIGKQFIDSSFPSSHMASTLAVLTVLVYFYQKVWPYAIVFALLMAFSRIHNGMHYPTDVLVGIILGIVYGFIAIWIVNLIKSHKKSFNQF